MHIALATTTILVLMLLAGIALAEVITVKEIEALPRVPMPVSVVTEKPRPLALPLKTVGSGGVTVPIKITVEVKPESPEFKGHVGVMIMGPGCTAKLVGGAEECWTLEIFGRSATVCGGHEGAGLRTPDTMFYPGKTYEYSGKLHVGDKVRAGTEIGLYTFVVAIGQGIIAEHCEPVKVGTPIIEIIVTVSAAVAGASGLGLVVSGLIRRW